jgi:hypothetical protein
VAISPAIKLYVLDAGANLVTSATNSVTLVIGTNPGGGTLSGTVTVAANSGVATFSDISIDKVGIGYALVASSTGLTSFTSDVFDINVGLPSQLAFSVQPFNSEVKQAITPTVKVQVHDAGANVVPTATNAITLAIGTNPSNGILSGTLIVPAVAGEVAFSGISIDKVGIGYILTATYAGLTTITSDPFDIIDTLVTTIDTGTSVLQTEIANLQQQIDASITQATAGIAADVASIKQDTTVIKEDTGSTLQERLDALETTVTSILEDTSTTIEKLETVEQEVQDSAKAAKILNRPTTVKRGESVSIEFQTDSGLSPVLDFYDPNNTQQVNNAAMTEIGTTGVYRYDLPVGATLPLGDYTVIVTEPTKGSLDSFGLSVADSDLASIGSDFSSVGTEVSDLRESLEKIEEAATESQTQANTAASAAKEARDLIELVQAQIKAQRESPFELMSKLQAALNIIKDAVLAPEKDIGSALAPIEARIAEISELLRAVSSENGVNMDAMYNSIESTTTEVSEVKDKVERLRVMLETNQEIAEKVLERSPPKEAVIKTWFEAG